MSKYVGTSMKRREDPRFLRGHGSFVANLKLPNMAYLAIKRSPYAHARIRSIDTTKAKSIPGVIGVFTGADTSDVGMLPCGFNVPDIKVPPNRVLQTDKVRHVGDPVAPVGFAASQGKIYSQGSGAEPVLYVSRTNRASFNNPTGAVYNAIAGNIMLVAGGKVMSELIQSVDGDVPQPRTALALDKSGRRLIIIVVDGRQPRYSQGATLAELAGIIAQHGGFYGMNMDGGGSTALVMAAKNGRPRLLNSPIDNRIPGRERPVGNHLGIFAAP